MAATPQPAPYPLRMPEELRAQLSERAKANGRSVNGEILAILSSALATHTIPLSSISSGDLLDEVMRRYGRQVHLTINTTPQSVPPGSDV